MKKFYILGFVFLTGNAFGQSLGKLKVQDSKEAIYLPSEAGTALPDAVNNGTLRAPGDLIYGEDFGSGLGGWTAGGTHGQYWVRAFTVPNGAFVNPATQTINSTTKANGFIAYASDSSNTIWPAGTSPVATRIDRDGHITSPVLPDMSSLVANGIMLSFEQRYRHCCGNDFEFRLVVSSDNFATENVTLVVSDRGAVPFLNRVNILSTTLVTKVDLTATINSLANKANVRIRFLHSGVADVTSAYFWQIDDIKVYEKNTNDLKMASRRYGSGNEFLEYPVIPTSQLTAISFEGIIQNLGSTAANAGLEIDVTNAASASVFNQTGSISIPPAAEDTIDVSAWTPAGPAGEVYTVNFIANHPSTDDDPNDNTLTRTIRVHDYVYARDEAGVDVNAPVVTSFITNWSAAGGQNFRIGNLFEIFAAADMTAVDIGVASTTNVVNNPTLYGQVYRWDPVNTEFVYVGDTEELDLLATHVGKILTLPLFNRISTQPGEVYLVVAGHYGGATDGSDDIRISSSGATYFPTVMGFDAASGLVNLLSPLTPVVRANFNPVIGVNEVTELAHATLGQNYPNPFDATTRIEYSVRENTPVTFEVTDITGKVILTRNEGMKSAGDYSINLDASQFASGLYLYSIQAGDVKLTKKMIVK